MPSKYLQEYCCLKAQHLILQQGTRLFSALHEDCFPTDPRITLTGAEKLTYTSVKAMV